MKIESLSEALVVLDVPPTLEDAVIDWLLERPDNTGFSSTDSSGHSTAHENLSAAEQVSGRARRLQFQIHLPRAAVQEFMTDAHKNFGSADIHFWVTPLLNAGYLADFGEDAS